MEGDDSVREMVKGMWMRGLRLALRVEEWAGGGVVIPLPEQTSVQALSSIWMRPLDTEVPRYHRVRTYGNTQIRKTDMLVHQHVCDLNRLHVRGIRFK